MLEKGLEKHKTLCKKNQIITKKLKLNKSRLEIKSHKKTKTLSQKNSNLHLGSGKKEGFLQNYCASETTQDTYRQEGSLEEDVSPLVSPKGLLSIGTILSKRKPFKTHLIMKKKLSTLTTPANVPVETRTSGSTQILSTIVTPIKIIKQSSKIATKRSSLAKLNLSNPPNGLDLLAYNPFPSNSPALTLETFLLDGTPSPLDFKNLKRKKFFKEFDLTEDLAEAFGQPGEGVFDGCLSGDELQKNFLEEICGHTTPNFRRNESKFGERDMFTTPQSN